MMSESNTPDRDNINEEFDVIYRYTRAQAIADGVLVDLTEWARETNFVIPVACTRAVWDGYVVPPPGTAEYGQSERGRAHDLLWMCYVAIRQRGGADHLMFEVIFINRRRQQETVTLKAVCGPGDEGTPVLTIMLPLMESSA